MKFKESKHAHYWLDGLKGVEIGGSAHNPFGLDTINVDYTDDMTTIFKRHELLLCGEAMPVDIVSPGDKLPFSDNQFDFVISSHVIEHIFDPVAAIKEWIRVASKYVYVIAPQPWALESDRVKPITPLKELIDRHSGAITLPEVDTHEHYTRWTVETFLDMCAHFNFPVVDSLRIDDKVGNGFSVVIRSA